MVVGGGLYDDDDVYVVSNLIQSFSCIRFVLIIQCDLHRHGQQFRALFLMTSVFCQPFILI